MLPILNVVFGADRHRAGGCAGPANLAGGIFLQGGAFRFVYEGASLR
jgi:hypothetical protein